MFKTYWLHDVTVLETLRTYAEKITQIWLDALTTDWTYLSSHTDKTIQILQHRLSPLWVLGIFWRASRPPLLFKFRSVVGRSFIFLKGTYKSQTLAFRPNLEPGYGERGGGGGGAVGNAQAMLSETLSMPDCTIRFLGYTAFPRRYLQLDMRLRRNGGPNLLHSSRCFIPNKHGPRGSRHHP